MHTRSCWGPESRRQAAYRPRGHITALLDKHEDNDTRSWYAAAAVEHVWSRNVLLNMITNQSMQHTGAAASNFTRQLSAPDSELTQQVAKDPCAFKLLGLSGKVTERDLEDALIDRIVETLRVLGPDFASISPGTHRAPRLWSFAESEDYDKLVRQTVSHRNVTPHVSG